jgi:ribosomal protein L29
MMEEGIRRDRQQARLTRSLEERRVAAIEDIADSLMDLKDELMQIRMKLTEPQMVAPRPGPPRP